MAAFYRQPHLESNSIRLRPLEASDWEALFEVACDPKIWVGHPASDRWQEPVFREYFATAMASGGALVAVDPRTQAVKGASRYDRERVEPGEIEIGWTFLTRAHWGGGANAAMKTLMIGYALEHYRQVVCFVGAANIRSQRAMTRIGGVLTGRQPAPLVDGVAVPHVVFAIDRAGFANGPLRQSRPA
jgi:RimJ/RimL family protein N-acetyltransferase